MAQSDNFILASLPATSFAEIKPLIRPVSLRRGDVLAETGTPIEYVYFPYSGIISLVVEMSEGDMIETAMTGRDGVWGAIAALDGELSVNKVIVQLEGAAAVMTAADLRAIAKKNDAFRSLLIRHEQFILAQAQQSAACNATHLVEPRMCRWLLRMRDTAVQDDLNITQEFLGQMMGVRRTSVSLIAATLQKAGFIKYSRGHVRILDADGLSEAACECYETVNAHYKRLFSGKSK
ncbi:MAG TPA: Crp/Fnr family transcriptional regulator [Xanthobacteraceae bacterium]|jgi:CRP-like cAMP-binding protein|nr:Crp/Fnr family transcriptional regulator [Xanthobacteraceae bacterium]